MSLCSAFLAAAMQYNSGTDYSDDDEAEEEAHDSDDDADSICSGSTLSADGQDSVVSDIVDSQFEDMYSDGGCTLLFRTVPCILSSVSCHFVTRVAVYC